jgi:hypothetical protein
MPEGFIAVAPSAEQATRERALVKARKDGGMVGPHPLSRQAGFARGETVPAAPEPWTTSLPGLPPRRQGAR